jgi:hypothetical protein
MEAAAADQAYARRMTDHIEPCGLLQVVQSEVVNIKEDIGVLYKRVDRLPTWMVMLFSATTGTLGAAITAIYFLAARIDRIVP